MADDPVATYLTLDRVKCYCELRAEFPLWCGLWPTPYDTSIERNRWSVRSLVDEDASKIIAQVRSLLPAAWRSASGLVPFARMIRVSNAGDVPGAELLVWNQGTNRVRSIATPPSTLTTLLRARFFIVHSTAIRDIWLERLTGRLHADVPFAGDFPSGTSAAAATTFALLAELAWRSPLQHAPSRGGTVQLLEDDWLKLGRDVGIIPSIGRRTRITLANAFLRKLVDEGKRLVRAVVEYEASVDDLAATLVLLNHPAAVPEAVETAHAKRAERKGLSDTEKKIHRQDAAKIRQRRIREAADKDPDVGRWARRLRFPMLSAAEIGVIDGEPLARSSVDARTKLAQRLTARRLLVALGTLQNRVARTKH